MMLEIVSWLGVFVTFGLLRLQFALLPPESIFLVLASVLAADLLLVASKASHTCARFAPLLALTAVLTDPATAVWSLVSLLLGGILIVGTQKPKQSLNNARFGCSLLPIAMAGLIRHFYGDGTVELILASSTFALFSIFFVPNAPELRLTFLQLLCAPGLAVAGRLGYQYEPVLLLLLLPLIAVASLGRDESFPLLIKLREALSLTQLKLQAQGKKLARYSKLLTAAQLLSTQMSKEDLDSALAKALRVCDMDGVSVSGEADVLSVPEQLSEEKRALAGILTRMYLDCARKVELHAQVVEALDELQRSQAQTLASSRLAAIGRLAAGVAHEVNTPMGAIVLASELGEAYLDKDLERARTQFERIRHSSETVKKSVTRLLHYSQPDRFSEESWFEVQEVLNDSLELNSFHLKRSRAELKVEFSDAVELHGKRYDLHLLLSNLMVNALGACSGLESPQIIFRSTVQSDKSLLLEVLDNGPGVPPDVRDNIFEAFFTTKPSGEGNGLGLFLARQAAESLGGAIRYRDGRLGGACFQVRFPSESFRKAEFTTL